MAKQVQFEGQMFDFPDDATDEEIGSAIEKYRPRGALDLETYTGAVKSIPAQLKKGATALASQFFNKTEAEYIDMMPATELEKETLARDWYGKPLSQIRAEAEAAKLGNTRQQLKDLSAGYAQDERDAMPANLTTGGEVATSVIKSLPASAAALATGGVMGIPAGLAVAGTMAGADSLAQGLEKGVDDERALGTAALVGATEAAFEKIPLEFALSKSKSLMSKVLGMVVREEATELPTTLVQSTLEKAGYNPEMPMSEFVGQLQHDLLITALATPFSAGIQGGGMHGIQRLAERYADKTLGQVVGDELGGIRESMKKIQESEEGSPEQTAAMQELEARLNGLKGDELSSGNIENIPQGESKPLPTTSSTPESINAVAAALAVDPETITDEQLSEARSTVQAWEKAQKEGELEPDNPSALAALAGIDDLNATRDLGELGESNKVVANQYLNPNDDTIRSRRKVLFGPEGTQGKRITQTAIAETPGTYTLGEPTQDRSEEYLGAVHEQIEAWRQKWLPKASFVILNESLPTGTAVGWHSRLPSGVHVVTPAVLRNMKDQAKFNTNAQAKTFYNLAHEFGHALVYDRFFEGVDPALAEVARMEAKTGVISPETLQQLPESIRPVLEEFNAIKQQVLSGEMSALEFQMRWMNPTKFHKLSLASEHNVAEEAPATQLVDAILNRAFRANRAKQAGGLPPKELAKLRSEYLGLDEYLAEQTARYAYAKKLDQVSPLNKDSLFARAFASVRATLIQFFKELKSQDIIAPGMKFEEWLDGLTKTSKAEAKPGKASKRQPAKGTAKKATKAKGKEPKVQPVDHNVFTMTPAQQANGRKLIAGLQRDEIITDARAKELRELLKAADYSTFVDELQPYLETKVQLEAEVDYPADFMPAAIAQVGEDEAIAPAVLKDAAREWNTLGFASKYFKAWFGDWQNDPAASSKIRTADGKPLVSFHGTRNDFDMFEFGDVGFHFGTVRAAMARLLQSESIHATEDELRQAFETIDQEHLDDRGENAGAIYPVVLNIRNPLLLGEEHIAFWKTPPQMVNILEAMNIISEEEALQTLLALGELDRKSYQRTISNYDFFAPVRNLLMTKGYDGIVYRNVVEGDTSYVAFHPNQVKSVLGTKVFSKSPKIHMELDFDDSNPMQHGLANFRDKFKRFLPLGPMRRAFRHIAGARYNLVQLQQLAHLHPENVNLQFMLEKETEYERKKSALQAPADNVVFRWRDLGKEDFARVRKFLEGEQASGALWVQLQRDAAGEFSYIPNQVFYDKLKEFGLDPETEHGQEIGKLILDIKNSILMQVNEAERVLAHLIESRYSQAGSLVLGRAMLQMRKQVHDIRKRPFVPQGRFGNYFFMIQRKRVDAPGWSIVYREAFEDQDAWEAAVERAESAVKADERVVKNVMTDSEYVLMSLPHDFLALASSELGLSEGQVEHLFELLNPVKTEKALRVYDPARLKIKGASTDILRSYSNHMWHNANLLAKLRYRSEFNKAIRGVDAEIREAITAPGKKAIRALLQLNRIKNFMERTRDYIMTPPNEMHTLRALVSIAYLWANVKTAMMNVYGLITTYGDLTTRFGTKAGGAMMLRAIRRATVSFNPLDLNEVRDSKHLEPKFRAALYRAVKEGHLSQSYAYYLAGMANASNLRRMFGDSRVSGYTQKTVDLGMWAFRLAELGTRRVTFLAELEAEMKQQSGEFTDAYTAAVLTTNKLQNNFSLGNRVPIMRGLKIEGHHPLAIVGEAAIPMATIFMSFMQHMMFHAFGGYEIGLRRKYNLDKAAGLDVPKPPNVFFGYTAKVLLITLLLAGYEGLPGAENMLDLLDLIWKKLFGKHFRQDVREFVQSVGGDPVFWSHGLGHDVFGFNLSRSIGLGRVVPGTDTLARSTNDKTSERAVGALALDMLGPTGNFIEWAIGLDFNDKSFAENFKRAPGAVGNVVTAWDWHKNGVRGPAGGLITIDPLTGQPRDLTSGEVFGKALGFQPNIVAANRERIFAQHDIRMYWQARRAGLKDDLWKATMAGDREAIADTRQAIQDFNESTPEAFRRDLRISPKEIAASLKAHRRNQKAEESSLSRERRYRRIYQDVNESFKDPDSSP